MAEHTFCWNELMTGDVARAGDFYGQLFGWTRQTMETGGGPPYTLFKIGEQQVAGMMASPQPGAPPAWLAYVAVESADASVARARTLGAEVLHPPTDIPGIGRFSVLRDPTGAVFAVFQPARA